MQVKIYELNQMELNGTQTLPTQTLRRCNYNRLQISDIFQDQLYNMELSNIKSREIGLNARKFGMGWQNWDNLLWAMRVN